MSARSVVDVLDLEKGQREDRMAGTYLPPAAQGAVQSEGEPRNVQLEGDLLKTADFDDGVEPKPSKAGIVNATGPERLKPKGCRGYRREPVDTSPYISIFEDEGDEAEPSPDTSFQAHSQTISCVARISRASMPKRVRKAKNKDGGSQTGQGVARRGQRERSVI